VEWVESDSPIRFCYTVIDKGQKTVTELVEESEEVGEGTERRLFETFSRLIPGYSMLIISGTKAKGFSHNLIPEMVRTARAHGCRVILDVRGQDLIKSFPFGPDLVKPNFNEFISTFAPELLSEKNTGAVKKKVGRIWAELYEKHPCALVLTRGAEPLWYAEKGELAEFAFKSVEPLNTTGSGDAFSAGLAAALEEGASLAEAVAEGARCGALNAALLKPGVIR
jgi:fructose-1-phosphate kinase PfkB-like protein